MVNAQKYIEKKYLTSVRRGIRKLDLSQQKLEGKLDLNDFTNLEELDCKGNLLTGLNVDECSRLRVLDCSFNNLSKLDLRNLKKLTEVKLNNNDNLFVSWRKDMKELIAREEIKTSQENFENFKDMVDLVGLDTDSFRELKQILNGKTAKEVVRSNQILEAENERLRQELRELKQTKSKRSNRQVQIILPNSTAAWNDLHPDFTDDLTKSWQKLDFTYEECKDWISAGLTPYGSTYALWLKKTKNIVPIDLLDYAQQSSLEREFDAWYELQKLQSQIKNQIEHLNLRK